MMEGCECWRQCCDLGPHDCICGNDCEPPEPEAVTRAREDMVAALKAERDELRATVERVRSLHRLEQIGIGWASGGPGWTQEFCCHCEDSYFPCATVRALEGAGDE